MKDLDNLIIRLSQSEDYGKIVELLRKSFVKWEKVKDPLNYWLWKYVDTPFRSVIVVADIDKKIIGCNHGVYFNAKLGEAVEPIRWGDDVAVDPEYRGLNIYKKIIDYRDALPLKANYRYSTTGNPIIAKSWNKRHLSLFPHPIARMIRIKNFNLHLKKRPVKNAFFLKCGYFFLKTLGKIKISFMPTIEQSSDFTIDTSPQFDGGVDGFWDQVKDDYKFILEKKQTYLNWRISDPQWGRYQAVQARKEDNVLGFLITRISEENGYKEGYIMDLLSLKDRMDVVDALFTYALKRFDDEEVNVIYYQFTKGHPYQRRSDKHGFIESNSRPNLEVNFAPRSGSEGEIKFIKEAKPSQIYFTYGDTI